MLPQSNILPCIALQPSSHSVHMNAGSDNCTTPTTSNKDFGLADMGQREMKGKVESAVILSILGASFQVSI
jgi:hypothetical protein